MYLYNNELISGTFITSTISRNLDLNLTYYLLILTIYILNISITD